MTKAELLDFCRKYKRWPSQYKPGEATAYRLLKRLRKQDWLFNEEIKAYQQRKPGNPKAKGRPKGSKNKNSNLIRLGLFLMDSGGIGF